MATDLTPAPAGKPAEAEAPLRRRRRVLTATALAVAAPVAVAGGARYPSRSDPAGSVPARYGVMGPRTTVLVDASGAVGRHLGELSRAGLLEFIAEASGSDVLGGGR